MKAQCSHPKCSSGKPGLWEPIVLLWPEKPTIMPSQPASVNVIGHAVCQDCVNTSRVIDFIPNKESWVKIVRYFDENKKLKPSLKTAKLTFMIPETALLGGEKIV